MKNFPALGAHACIGPRLKHVFGSGFQSDCPAADGSGRGRDLPGFGEPDRGLEAAARGATKDARRRVKTGGSAFQNR